MQKVITVFVSATHSGQLSEGPNRIYENDKLNRYLEEGYKVIQVNQLVFGANNHIIALTFILENVLRE